MSNYLPNTSYYYDMSTAKGMDLFLKYIYTIAKSNPELIVSPQIIYNELKFDNLKRIEVDEFSQGISTMHFFEKWRQRFNDRKNIRAFRDEEYYPYFFQFKNRIKDDNGEYIKLYIPFDYEHLDEGVNQLFDFLDSENIEHESYVASQMRVDNVIVRLQANDFDNANKIIDFITKNSKTKNGFNKVNPFIPTRKNIGIMSDKGSSYNMSIAKYISEFIIESIKLNRSDVSAEEFRSYLKTYCYDMDVLDTFELAYNGHSRVNTEEGILNGPLSEEQKYMLFLDTLKNTYRRHGINQAKSAIVHAIENNDYEYFSRGNNRIHLRNNLKKFVNPDNMFNMIQDRLKLFYDPSAISINIEGLASQFCDTVFSDELMLLLDEISTVTLEKRGPEQLEYALNNFFMTGNMDNFSRYRDNDKINYRKMLKYFDNKTLLSIVSKSLKVKGIDCGNFRINDLIPTYVSNLAESYYLEEDNSYKAH